MKQFVLGDTCTGDSTVILALQNGNFVLQQSKAKFQLLFFFYQRSLLSIMFFVVFHIASFYLRRNLLVLDIVISTFSSVHKLNFLLVGGSMFSPSQFIDAFEDSYLNVSSERRRQHPPLLTSLIPVFSSCLHYIILNRASGTMLLPQ